MSKIPLPTVTNYGKVRGTETKKNISIKDKDIDGKKDDTEIKDDDEIFISNEDRPVNVLKQISNHFSKYWIKYVISLILFLVFVFWNMYIDIRDLKGAEKSLLNVVNSEKTVINKDINTNKETIKDLKIDSKDMTILIYKHKSEIDKNTVRIKNLENKKKK